jgi:hypothetical protein
MQSLRYLESGKLKIPDLEPDPNRGLYLSATLRRIIEVAVLQEFENNSLEELRCEVYMAARKWTAVGLAQLTGGLFGTPQQRQTASGGLFGSPATSTGAP